MQIKIRERAEVAVSSYSENGGSFVLTIKDKFKDVVLKTDSDFTLNFRVVEIPRIINYTQYTKFSFQSDSYLLGCFNTIYFPDQQAPLHAFPTWDNVISRYPHGVTFGAIKLKDFFKLQSYVLVSPNYNLYC